MLKLGLIKIRLDQNRLEKKRNTASSSSFPFPVHEELEGMVGEEFLPKTIAAQEVWVKAYSPGIIRDHLINARAKWDSRGDDAMRSPWIKFAATYLEILSNERWKKMAASKQVVFLDFGCKGEKQ
jgi:hypothetical protein